MNIKKNNIGKLYLMIRLNNCKVSNLMNLEKEKELENQSILTSKMMLVIRKILNLNMKLEEKRIIWKIMYIWMEIIYNNNLSLCRKILMEVTMILMIWLIKKIILIIRVFIKLKIKKLILKKLKK